MTDRLKSERVLVVGLGASGLAAAELLRDRGARVVANDQRREPDIREDRLAAARAAGVELVLGGHPEALFTSVDRIVVSPGVPRLSALAVADAAGIPIASEVELASWFFGPDATVIAVTGTNGKSTVTTLIGDACERTGRPTFVGGNLGTPLVAVVGTEAAQRGFVVVELSSFQLERVDRFRAHVAVLLNVSDDHLDRYDGLADYAAAKARIFHGQRRGDAAVIPAGDAVCAALARGGAATVHTYGDPDGVVRVRSGRIENGTSSLAVPVESLRVAGRHNVDNACAAALAARLAGVDADRIAAALGEFGGLPHRMQLVRELAGVRYYDDSKATNVGAAVAALDGLPEGVRAVVVAGGVDKGGSYAPLAARLAAVGRGVVLIGEAAPLIERALRDTDLPIEQAPDMRAAVDRARALAHAGDVVLLAPACSSFDMFGSYGERGDAFADAVRALPEEEAT